MRWIQKFTGKHKHRAQGDGYAGNYSFAACKEAVWHRQRGGSRQEPHGMQPPQEGGALSAATPNQSKKQKQPAPPPAHREGAQLPIARIPQGGIALKLPHLQPRKAGRAGCQQAGNRQQAGREDRTGRPAGLPAALAQLPRWLARPNNAQPLKLPDPHQPLAAAGDAALRAAGSEVAQKVGHHGAHLHGWAWLGGVADSWLADGPDRCTCRPAGIRSWQTGLAPMLTLGRHNSSPGQRAALSMP